MSYEAEVGPVVLKAIEKGLAKLGDRDGPIAEGVYPVNARVSIVVQGSVEKLRDTSALVPPKISLPLALAIAFKKASVSRSAAAALIRRTVEECLALEGEPEQSLADRVNDAEKLIAQATEKKARQQPRSGATKWSGTLSIVAQE